MLEKIPTTHKETLLAQIWEDKKERRDQPRRLALYLRIDSPLPNIERLTESVFQALLVNPEASEKWARGWGETVVCISQNLQNGASIEDKSDVRVKKFQLVQTNSKINPRLVFTPLPIGTLGDLVLNHAPTTIEAMLICYVHMLDEVIWDEYRQALAVTKISHSVSLYEEAVRRVHSQGVNLKFASTEAILDKRAKNAKVTVRLYGSMVNKDVPKVMGAFIPNTLPQPESIKLADHTPGPILVSSGTTLGKEPHAGHLLLLAVADLTRSASESKEPLIMINNNTGPRPAGALLKLSELLNVTPFEAAKKAAAGDISPETIVTSYRSRIIEDNRLGEAIKLLDESGLDIFAPIVNKINPLFKAAGFDIDIKSEATLSREHEKTISDIANIWAGTGFAFAQTDQGLRILQKAGALTASGKMTVTLSRFSERPATIVFVDSDQGTTDATQTIDKHTFNSAYQTPGTGIGFEGKIASGSRGESLTLTQLLSEFENLAPPKEKLAKALKVMVLTQPLTIPDLSNLNLSTSFYDFKDNKSFVNLLVKCSQTRGDLLLRAAKLEKTLTQKQGSVTQTTPELTDLFKYLPQKVDAFEKLDLNGFLGKSGKISPANQVRDDREIMQLIRSLSPTDTNLELAAHFVYSQIAQGSSLTIQDLLNQALAKGFRKRTKVEDGPGKSRILSFVKNQGYKDNEALELAIKYSVGDKGLFIRPNPYCSQLLTIMAMENMIFSITRADLELINKMLNTCLTRLDL